MPPLVHPRIVLARLQAELRRPAGQGHVRRADIQALVAYVQRCLRVMPWVRHAPGCQQSIRHGKAVGCTCGLTAAWRGEGDTAGSDTADGDTAGSDTTGSDTTGGDDEVPRPLLDRRVHR